MVSRELMPILMILWCCILLDAENKGPGVMGRGNGLRLTGVGEWNSEMGLALTGAILAIALSVCSVLERWKPANLGPRQPLLRAFVVATAVGYMLSSLLDGRWVIAQETPLLIAALSITLLCGAIGCFPIHGRQIGHLSADRQTRITSESLLIVLAGIVLATALRSGAPLAVEASIRVPLYREWSHFTAPPAGKVVIVEFADLQCPVCAAEAPILQKIAIQFRGQVAIVYRHNPLSALHPRAWRAAEASECMDIQGHFWDGIEWIFSHQSDLSRDAMDQYASQLGLNREEFGGCMDSHQVESRVQSDKDDANALSLDQTPVLFIDGRRLNGWQSYGALKMAIVKAETKHGGSSGAVN